MCHPKRFSDPELWPGDSTVVFMRDIWDSNQELSRALSLTGHALSLRQGSWRRGMVRMEYKSGGTVAVAHRTKLNVF